MWKRAEKRQKKKMERKIENWGREVERERERAVIARCVEMGAKCIKWRRAVIALCERERERE